MAKKEKKTRKTKGSALAAVLVILALGAAAFGVWYLMNHGGFGSGLGTGEAVQADAEISRAEDTAETTVATETEEYVEVKVSGNSYLFQDKEYSVEDIDALLAEVGSVDSGISIMITDEDASVKAYDSLTEGMTEKGIAFIEAK